MADDIEKLILSISADTAQVKRSLDRLEKDVDRSTKGIEKGFTSAGAQMGTAFDASAAKINRSFTVIEGGARRAQTNVTQSVGAIRASTQNLSFQLNDIATQLASGTSPFQVMAQQGGQVVQSLTGAGGVLGALRIVGAAALNPFTLATVAITTLAGVATAYFRDTSNSVEEATKKMEEHRDAVKAAIDAWDGAPPPELTAYVEEVERLEKQTKQLAGLQVVIDKGLEPIREAAARAAEGFEELYARLQARNVDATVLSDLKRDFDAMKEAIDGGNASAIDLLPLFTRLQELEAQIGTTKGFDALKLAIQDLAPLLDTVNAKLETTRKTAAAVRSGLDPNIYGGGPNQGFIPTINLPDSAPTPDFGDFSGLLPNQSRDPFVAAGEAAAAAMIRKFEGFRPEAYWDVNAFRTGYGSDTTTRSNGMIERVTSETIVTLDEAEADLSRRIMEFQAGIQAAIGAERWRAMTADQQAALTSVAYNYGSLPKSVVSAIQGGGNVGNAIGSLSANPSRRAQEAAAFGGATLDVGAVKQATDAWAGLRNETQQTAAVTQQVGQEYSVLQSVGVTALNGLKNALADGKIEGKELLGIMIDIVQQLLTAQQTAGGISFGGAAGAGGGGGLLGGIGSLVGSLFGFEKGGIAAHGRPAPLKRFSSGGISRSAAIFGEAGPEAAVPLPDGRSIPVNLNLPKMPRAAAQAQQQRPQEVIIRGTFVDDNGVIKAQIDTRSSAITQAGIKQMDKNMPARVNEVMERQGRG
jgi:GH24 family phage-related lysozyme (muramidase)